jgi:hypothetical protein
MTPEEAIGTVMAAFPMSNVPNPQKFVEMAVAALERFQPQTLAKLADPSKGILSKAKFIPSIAELISECEKIERKGSKNFV